MPPSNKRTLIMAAAEKLFTSRRFHEITLDDIAREAHVGKGTIYTHFRDKNDLFFQVTTSGLDDLCDLLRLRVSSAAPFAQQLQEACGEVCSFFAKRRELFRMIQSEEARMAFNHGELRERWMHRRLNLVEAMADVLRRGVSTGLVRADITAEFQAELLLGMLRAVTRSAGNGIVDPQRYSLMLDVFINGAGLGPTGGPEATTGVLVE
ncbi:TetR/AcrR family transcriptional regulator [Desulfocurvibacter africanus]|uniref:TetR/AcrR family transcriptional regulator n=1 Tax=Desulfocurvibacter africanus TaxID=873 RepID=UPI002FDADD15